MPKLSRISDFSFFLCFVGIAARINEGKRKFENLQKVQAIHGYDELVQPDRFLLRAFLTWLLSYLLSEFA